MNRRRTRCPRLAILLITVALGLVACLPSAVRAEGTLELVQVGWDGKVAMAGWNPVRVKVAGGAADAIVRVEVVLRAKYQMSPQNSVEFPVGAYGEDVSLPAGASKEVTLWVPAENSGGPSIATSIVRATSGGQTLAEVKVDSGTPRTPSWPLIGVLAESPAVARSLSQIELPVQGLAVPLSVAGLSVVDLPRSAELLGGLTALVVQGNAPTPMTDEQRRAIRGWVEAGGHLVLAGGPTATQTSGLLPAGVLPVTMDGVEGSADLAGLASWAAVSEPPSSPGPVALFRVDGGSPLAGSADRPLVWRLGLGQGTVTLLAIDPSLEPLATWAGTPALLRKALEPALPLAPEDEKMRLVQRMEQDTAMRLQGVVDALPRDALPSGGMVALVLGVFAIVAGPLLHLLLWRTDRRGWIWLAVPVAALLLSGTLYYLGIGRDGRDVLANVVGYLRLDPSTGQGERSTAIGFFAPTYERLTVEVPGEEPVRVINRSGSAFGPGGVPFGGSLDIPFHVVAGRTTRVEFASGQWGMRTLTLPSRPESQPGMIVSNLGLENGVIRGTIRNGTSYLLEDAAVVVGQSFVKLGNLAPGQSVPVALDPASAPVADPFRGNSSLAYRLFGNRVTDPYTVSYGVSRAAVAPPVPVPVATKPPTGVASASSTPTPAASPAPGGTAPAATEPGDDGADAAPSPAEASPPPTAAPMVDPADVQRALDEARAAAAGAAVARSVPVGVPERFELPPDPEIQRRVRLMDSTVGSMRSGPYGQQGVPLTFLAFTCHPMEETPSAGNHPTYPPHAGGAAPLPGRLPPGPFTMPSGLIQAESVEQGGGGMGGGSNGTVFWMEIHGGTATYSFRAPLSPNARVSAMVVTTRQVGSATSLEQAKMGSQDFVAGPAQAGLFSLYNQQAGRWDPLPAGKDEARVEPAAAYVGRDGLIRVQVSAPADQVVRFVPPELVLEGEVEP